MSTLTRPNAFRQLLSSSSLVLLAACAGAASSDPVSRDPALSGPDTPGAEMPSALPGTPAAPGAAPADPASGAPAADPVPTAPAPVEDDATPADAPGSNEPGAEDPIAADDVDTQLAALNQSFAASDRASVDGPSYFRLRADLRRCASPLCGGFFVSRVNSLSTLCVDGARSAECYVTGLDWSALALGSDAAARVAAAPEDMLLAGEIVPESTDFGELGRLRVTEAWQGHAGVERNGAFLRVVNDGIVCITNPCLSFSAEILNARLPTVAIAELDLEGISGDASDGFQQLNEAQGLLVVALPEIVSGPGGRAIGLDASEYYLPLAAEAACGSRGLPECAAGTFCAFPATANCGRADAPGTCAPRPEACTQQYDPVCGCDGQTYGNACAAASAGVSVESAGECASSSD